MARPIFGHCFTDALQQQPQISLSNTQGYLFHNPVQSSDSHSFRLHCGEKITTVRLNVEENQLVNVFGEFGICLGGLKSA